MKSPTFATRWNADLVEQNYQRWLQNPASLDAEWQAFFEGFELASALPPKPAKTAAAQQAPSRADIAAEQCSADLAAVLKAINIYRFIGHTQAHLNPLQIESRRNPQLSLEALGLDKVDPEQKFPTGDFMDGSARPLREIIALLEEIYCQKIGAEFRHVQDIKKRNWLHHRLESCKLTPDYSKKKKIRILKDIIRAETFERFLHRSYVGQKRFSLEGGETLIAALETIIEDAPRDGVEQLVMGMAHRGRLNVLVNTCGKSVESLFQEFSENFIPDSVYGDGDVKYHKGYELERINSSGKAITVALTANPSHLEAVNPVVLGKTRARQRILKDSENRKKAMPMLIHGDAAFIGQGIVAETLNLSRLKGYKVGGTVHFVVNNQIGFTTDPTDSRSSQYCSDIAMMIEVPIFHANGDDPEAVVLATEIAYEYRQEFGDDAVVDMYCYRKHGHNEADEPAFTQPELYHTIAQHPGISDIYSKKLLEEGSLTQEEIDAIKQECESALATSFKKVKTEEVANANAPRRDPKRFNSFNFKSVETAVDEKILRKAVDGLIRVPEGFQPNPKIRRQFESRLAAFKAGEGIDWGFGEALAFATLLMEKIPVRLSGQDSQRGTFSHRHAVIHNMATRDEYIPLNDLGVPGQAKFSVYNSALSEAAVLGFDYGYSLDFTEMLCIWEAQFGDFANGAQIIIDQFVTAAESKWGRVSGLVMLLPHGYEGQGPEHSSGRVERFLQLCGDNNIQVCNFTTPAQLFHGLRRQMKREFKKPLIIMSPKSLLRHKSCVSTLQDFSKGSFHEILDDTSSVKKAERLILCSGKVYYDILAEREARNVTDAPIIRIEQLYPFNETLFKTIFQKYPGVKKIVWCQEEPKNMGGWTYINPVIENAAGIRPVYAGRRAAASPAVGSLAQHKLEQAALLNQAFTL
ncbi:MAG: 2-oxoglutarate dehydrogenase E1 component [Puniceicoccales bacterium]|jgi:2-oxoglutarate dehydrogenase E1 component|nr:2-oxoglutarate dehydrogenase E1 component [Puniceicoccales bacterium]